MPVTAESGSIRVGVAATTVGDGADVAIEVVNVLKLETVADAPADEAVDREDIDQ